MVSQKTRGVNGSPRKNYHAPNAPHRIAAVRYGNTIRSERTSSGILRTPPAIAFDHHVLTEATGDGCDTVEVFITDSQTLYTVSVSDFWRYGAVSTRCGKQVVLSLKYWTVNGQAPQAAPQAPQSDPQAPPAAAQLALFGGAQ